MVQEDSQIPDVKAVLALVSGVCKELSSAQNFSAQLEILQERYGDSPEEVGEGYAAMLSAFFASGMGMAAALSPSLEEMPGMVREACKGVVTRDPAAEKRSLKRQQRRYYELFTRNLTGMLNYTAEAVCATIECYLAGDYDPDANPNDMILEALLDADADPEQAKQSLVRAGAIALHGRPLWWRWHVEADGPLSTWLIAISELLYGYTYTNQSKLRKAAPPLSLMLYLSPIKELGNLAPLVGERAEETNPITELVRALIDQGEQNYTEEQLAFCVAHRDEVIPALIELASDTYLQLEDSPGEGYAPIRAVEILGKLKATEAITTLIDIVADSEPEAIIYSTAIYALKEIGSPALEPILDFMRYSWYTWAKVGLGEVIEGIVEGEDPEVYQVLASVWEEVDWEDGRCLLAWPLIRTGGAQAIPLLQEALTDPDLDQFDYREIAAALKELGVESPPFAERKPVRSPSEWREMGYTLLSKIATPDYVSESLSNAPSELQTKPQELARLYSLTQRSMWAPLLITLITSTPAEMQSPLINGFLDALEVAELPPAPKELPAWMRRVYRLLPQELDDHLIPYLEGILLPLLYYVEGDYDIADEPDQLLAQARELSPDDERMSTLFGKAGALVLHGRQFWPLWPQESDPPLSSWLEGLSDLNTALKKVGQVPFHLQMEMDRQKELATSLMDVSLGDAKDVVESAPSPVKELLQELVELKQGTLPPARRRAFARHQAALVPYLIEMAEDVRYWYSDGPGEGWAAILAIRLLGEFRAAQAATALVRAVANTEPADIIHDTALFSLIAIGHQAFPAVRAYMRYGRNIQVKASLAEVVGQIGKRERESFDLLRSVWENATWSQNRRMAALAFGDLGDPRAVPLLQAALNDKAADVTDLEYVCWALEQLGVRTPPPLRRSSRTNFPPPYNPRLIYDKETEKAQRLRYTPWGEPLCPDCGAPLELDESGMWTHPHMRPAARSTSSATQRAKRRRRRRR